jgi:arginase family enzyme
MPCRKIGAVEVAANPAHFSDCLDAQLSASPARRPRVALIGFPSDEGVRRNCGRSGAAFAPALILGAFLALPLSVESEPSLVHLLRNTLSRGPSLLSGDLERDQRALADEIRPFLEAGTVPIVIGGGHETAFGHFLGYVEARRSVRILNWVVHADVRPIRNGKGHPGSPFQRKITHESRLCFSYTVIGLQPYTDPAHLNLITSHGGHYFPCRGLTAAIKGISRSLLKTPAPPCTASPSACTDGHIRHGCRGHFLRPRRKRSLEKRSESETLIPGSFPRRSVPSHAISGARGSKSPVRL